MNATRRNFLGLAVSGIATVLNAVPLLGQLRRQSDLHPPVPEHAGGGLQTDDHVPHPPPSPRDRRQQLHKCLHRVSECTKRLRDMLGDVETAEVLSVAVYKETQTLERLAKQLKALAKG